MADPRLSQSATRLSEDIGDVLSAIRRMIAEDEALNSTRDRLRAERDALDSLIHSDTLHEDAGEFLARRYGGNAALARKMVGATDPRPANVIEESWPLGDSANASDAARPKQVLRHGQFDARTADPSAIHATVAPANDTAPLRLEQRVQQPEPTGDITPKRGGWRSWIRSEPRKSLDTAAKQAIEDSPNVEIVLTSAAQEFEGLVDDDSDFAEAFDWKSRMRPELPTTAASLPVDTSPQMSADDEDDKASSLITEVDAGQGIAEDEVEASPPQLNADDPALRDLLREIIQEELQGEMGQRFSSNLRAVIRREVATVIDQHLDRF
ncbi:hypothetical protein H4P12_11330 [Paracoccus sp. 11-3]|uniref:Uncharacterized protein n=1 Tax=Paracoccus amoyensis TaxID=2760093 RepID=A0A926G7J6_9RHOB|nr:hypothetical protein [Paracoccus amoyensis]MBC9247288.1 hypothetical protein [Paracoccus amoyensis]